MPLVGANAVTLRGNVAAKIEVGGTRNPAAFDAYLRASNAYRRFGPANLVAGALNKEGLQSAVAAYTEAHWCPIASTCDLAFRLRIC